MLNFLPALLLLLMQSQSVSDAQVHSLRLALLVAVQREATETPEFSPEPPSPRYLSAGLKLRLLSYALMSQAPVAVTPTFEAVVSRPAKKAAECTRQKLSDGFSTNGRTRDGP